MREDQFITKLMNTKLAHLFILIQEVIHINSVIIYMNKYQSQIIFKLFWELV